MDEEGHWDQVYRSKKATDVSWYQLSPDESLRRIQGLGDASARIVDVGAGASLLVDALLDAGYRHPVVVDISAAALDCAKERLGARSNLVQWLVADVTKSPSLPEVDIWHDRAVLHFLTAPSDQRAYAELAAKTICKGGHAVIATFAPDGPERCSGLLVQRHDGQSIGLLLGGEFELVAEERVAHRTPTGVEQRFCWAVFHRR